MCDTIDIFCRSMKSDSDEWKRTEEFVIKSKDKLFDSFCVEAFFNAFSDEKIHMIDNETLDTMLWKKVPRIKLELNFAQIKAIADLFAHIVDYKSPFTSNHSMGVAEGAEKISRFMGFDEDICQKMYIAGALHDIGKVAIGNEILEKPEKLTDEEFKTMKHHAVYTYYILSGIDDFEEIRDWAALHHEKLNGKEYPFGKTADELNKPERIMACIDIYQALTEDRPYKKGLSHDKACGILDDMAQKGFVDSDISNKIRDCFG